MESSKGVTLVDTPDIQAMDGPVHTREGSGSMLSDAMVETVIT